MELWRLFDELAFAARKVGIEVRTEPFDPAVPERQGGRGGLCTVRGERLILVDARAPLPDRIAMIAEALARVDLDSVFLPPIVRATIGAYGHHSEPMRASPLDRRPIVRAGSRSRR